MAGVIKHRRFAPLMAGLIAFILFSMTVQTTLAGSLHPYTNDTGELQNALPRWGTIHFTGYPLYMVTGSSLVSVMRLMGINPAAASAFVSLLWGVCTAAVVALIGDELGASPITAVLGATLYSVSTSFWVDASITELHTFTMLFTALSLWLALRYHRTGKRRDMLWLGVAMANGIVHQRAVAGMGLGLLIIVWPHLKQIVRHTPHLLGISLAAFATYLYLPLRHWMGAEWTFGAADTWSGFWAIVLNQKNARDIDSVATEIVNLGERITQTGAALDADLPLIVLFVGLAGLWLMRARSERDDPTEVWRLRIGLSLVWLPYAIVPLLIYEGFIGDAILAVKLPVAMLAAAGWMILIERLQSWATTSQPQFAPLAPALLAFVVIASGIRNYPNVTAISRDRSLEAEIALLNQAANPDEPVVLSIIWSRTYWGAAYAQDFRGELEGVVLVDHNADFNQWLDEGYRLITPQDTFYVLPLEWWQARIDHPMALQMYAPQLVEIQTEAQIQPMDTDAFTVNDDLLIHTASISNEQPDSISLTVDWQARQQPERNYRIAVHLLATTEPTSGADILSQADQAHPVGGWSPTTTWQAGQTVQGAYQLPIPAESQPVALRITAYYIDEEGNFVNGAWYTIPLSEG